MFSRHVCHIARMLILVSGLAASCAAQQPATAPSVVDLKVADGVMLKASYFAAAKPGPGILLLHQCNKQRKDWDALAMQLAAAGFNVLTLDFRGLGESGGPQLTKLPTTEANRIVTEKWPSDVEAAYRYLLAQPGVAANVVGVGAASCGVYQAEQLAQHHREIKSLVFLSEAPDRAGRDFLRHSPNVPLLAVVTADDANPGIVEALRWTVYTSASDASKLVWFPTGGHGVDMFSAHPELLATIVAWFDSSLRKVGAPANNSPTILDRESQFLNVIDQPGGGEKAARVYADYRRDHPAAILFSEAMMNRLGYEYLRSGDAAGAIDIFKLNVTAYPDSANTYDSLADAYLANGDREQACEYSTKALDHLQTDKDHSPQSLDGVRQNSEKKLKALGDMQ